jgi:hypothetical protein
VEIAVGLVVNHPAVRGVDFAGSRSRGTHEELSDWDFAVQTSDFTAVARDLPSLVAPLEPLGQQWEPMGHFPVYQVLLRGPTKIEYLFLEHEQQPMPPPISSDRTLAAIDDAIHAFVARRNALEREYAVFVPRALEDEVRRGIRRISPAP